MHDFKNIKQTTEFKHVDLSKSYHNTFLEYVKDSSATEITTLKSLMYYNLTLNNGAVINGDIYWKEQKSYIVFKADNKKHVNYFPKEGVAQLKTIFKL